MESHEYIIDRRLSYSDKLNQFYTNIKNNEKYNFLIDYSGIHEELYFNMNTYQFYDSFIYCYNDYYLTFKISSIYNSINEIFKFLEQYGYWNYIPSRMEKFTNTKGIIGNNIICRQFFDPEKNLIRHYFSKSLILF